MRLSEGIHRHGFRTWYERQLLKSHAHMTLAFICTIGLLAAMEAASRYSTLQDRMLDALAVLLFAGAGIWSLRRYLYLLNHAEFVANQADCPGCGTYGRLELTGLPTQEESARVRCRKCAHCWSINA